MCLDYIVSEFLILKVDADHLHDSGTVAEVTNCSLIGPKAHSGLVYSCKPSQKPMVEEMPGLVQGLNTVCQLN